MSRGEIGVIPTDTLYGLVGSALIPSTVERIYRVRKRNSRKPMIVLISDFSDIHIFCPKLPTTNYQLLRHDWPAKTSIIFPVRGERFRYLHRGTHSVAFRVPKVAWLKQFLEVSGPLVAPSANPDGLPPAETIGEARNYFGRAVDFYSGRGRRASSPSRLVRFTKGEYTEVIRK